MKSGIGPLGVRLLMMVALGVSGIAFGQVEIESAGNSRAGAATEPAFPAFDAKAIKTVYSFDISKSQPGEEWSSQKTSRTPSGRAFVGGFTEQPVELTIHDLPPHKLLRISFDLYLLRSWDGSSRIWGAKIWDMGVKGGPQLIHTTFGNCGFFTDNNRQAFPDNYPDREHPAWTGSSERQTLKVIQSWGGPSRTFDTSSVYCLTLPFPHDAKDVTFVFQASLGANNDKTWGLNRVTVEAVPEPLTLSEPQMNQLWQTLGNGTPTEAFAATWTLISAGNPVAAYVAKHMEDEVTIDPAQVAAWAAEYGKVDDEPIDNRFFWKLLSCPFETAPIVRNLMISAQGETRSRYQFLLGVLQDNRDTSTNARLFRARHILEVIGTPECLKTANEIRVYPTELPEQ